MSPTETRVLVTGCTGFIGTHLISALLSSKPSTTVHIAHHPSDDPSHLLSLPNSHNLRFFSADLLDAAAISAAASGCSAGIFHVASPCSLEDPQDPQAELVLPAVQGTINVLEAAREYGDPQGCGDVIDIGDGPESWVGAREAGE